MLKLLCSAVIAAALVSGPARAQTSEYADPPADSGKSTSKTKSTTKAKAKTEAKTDAESKAKTKSEPSKGQLAMRERQKKCGAEWRAAKTAGKLEKGATWPKFWSACNTRLKAAERT